MVGLDTIFVIAAASIDLAFNEVGLAFDGHGGLSAGGTTRLLLDYPEPQRSEILDYLFLPSFGASVAVLKLEIGGDTQSTDGAEPSHMHSRYDLGCDRGYEGWLAAEAQRRNPSLKIWSLAWGVPGWIGNVSGHAPTYYCDDNMNYTIAWLKCLRDTHGVRSDYLGLWNERPQGSVDYVIALRKALDREGFPDVGITVEATWQPMIKNNVLTNPAFNASIVAASKHYPCNCSTFNYNGRCVVKRMREEREREFSIRATNLTHHPPPPLFFPALKLPVRVRGRAQGGEEILGRGRRPQRPHQSRRADDELDLRVVLGTKALAALCPDERNVDDQLGGAVGGPDRDLVEFPRVWFHHRGAAVECSLLGAADRVDHGALAPVRRAWLDVPPDRK